MNVVPVEGYSEMFPGMLWHEIIEECTPGNFIHWRMEGRFLNGQCSKTLRRLCEVQSLLHTVSSVSF